MWLSERSTIFRLVSSKPKTFDGSSRNSFPVKIKYSVSVGMYDKTSGSWNRLFVQFVTNIGVLQNVQEKGKGMKRSKPQTENPLQVHLLRIEARKGSLDARLQISLRLKLRIFMRRVSVGRPLYIFSSDLNIEMQPTFLGFPQRNCLASAPDVQTTNLIF